jgi:hypothetical protein
VAVELERGGGSRGCKSELKIVRSDSKFSSVFLKLELYNGRIRVSDSKGSRPQLQSDIRN